MQPFSVGRESVINLCNYVAIWRWFDARQPEIFDRFGAGAEASGQQRQRREHCRKRTFIPPICCLVVGDIVAAQCQRREGALSGPTTLLVDPLGRREDRRSAVAMQVVMNRAGDTLTTSTETAVLSL
jgi:hypothetical protein